ncbi:DUF2729 domain-containing protein [Citrobacter sp. wls827]|nr:DUF2729 domain-containing protein [Citrobacter sp. wls827]TKU42303.1 DUF2729 domain-containing protein [Citrobacter sp. wls716]TRL73295.1 DUF2729 domain-containing protein [Citrobacter youngae]
MELMFCMLKLVQQISKSFVNAFCRTNEQL